MRKANGRVIAALLVMLLAGVTSCASRDTDAGERKASAVVDDPRPGTARHNVVQYLPESAKSPAVDPQLADLAREVAGKVYYELKEEGAENLSSRLAVVNAVPLSDLKRESEFGRVLGEYLLTELADRGLGVTELRMGREINILPQTGEFILSRNMGELADQNPAVDYVVVSTFSNTRKTLMVQGRLVRLRDNRVKTAWRYSLPLTRELLGLFRAEEEPHRIAVKGMAR
ncbi:MAG: FlgO family outer membrane protein [Thermodesulfobacteriota bacterium]